MEFDLVSGIGGVFARKGAGEGRVALFDTKEQAERWAHSGKDIDDSLFDFGFVEVEVD